MALTLRLGADIVPPFIARPVAHVLGLGHAEEAELLVGAHAARQPIIHAADHREGFTARHVDFVHRYFNYGFVGGIGEDGGVRLEVFAKKGVLVGTGKEYFAGISEKGEEW